MSRLFDISRRRFHPCSSLLTRTLVGLFGRLVLVYPLDSAGSWSIRGHVQHNLLVVGLGAKGREGPATLKSLLGRSCLAGNDVVRGRTQLPLVLSVRFHLAILVKKREGVVDVELWRCRQTGRNHVSVKLMLRGLEHMMKILSEMLSARDLGKMEDSVIGFKEGQPGPRSSLDGSQLHPRSTSPLQRFTAKSKTIDGHVQHILLVVDLDATNPQPLAQRRLVRAPPPRDDLAPQNLVPGRRLVQVRRAHRPYLHQSRPGAHEPAICGVLAGVLRDGDEQEVRGAGIVGLDLQGERRVEGQLPALWHSPPTQRHIHTAAIAWTPRLTHRIDAGGEYPRLTLCRPPDRSSSSRWTAPTRHAIPMRMHIPAARCAFTPERNIIKRLEGATGALYPRWQRGSAIPECRERRASREVSGGRRTRAQRRPGARSLHPREIEVVGGGRGEGPPTALGAGGERAEVAVESSLEAAILFGRVATAGQPRLPLAPPPLTPEHRPRSCFCHIPKLAAAEKPAVKKIAAWGDRKLHSRASTKLRLLLEILHPIREPLCLFVFLPDAKQLYFFVFEDNRENAPAAIGLEGQHQSRALTPTNSNAEPLQVVEDAPLSSATAVPTVAAARSLDSGMRHKMARVALIGGIVREPSAVPISGSV
ncbi:hypothetical protein FB451DRAFT_1170313 [Mycena latifolia]|nr:hypothetical protein FB451DRAFT_1170313 [Mycena latifolia]